MNIAAYLMLLVLPLARKAFIGLGLSVVTYIGLDLILSQLQAYIVSSLGGMVGAAAQLAALFGFQESIGIIFAAITTKFAMAQLTHWVKS